MRPDRRPNVPLSATHQARISDLNDHTPYIPPHPQRGTPYHRYVLLFLPQPPLGGVAYTLNAEARAQPGVPTSVHLDVPPIGEAERRNFGVREFMQTWGLDGAKGGGSHMWREVWDKRVSGIYKTVLSKSDAPFHLPFPFLGPGPVISSSLTRSLRCTVLMWCLALFTEEPEPRYGRQPKADLYSELKHRKRYI